MALLPSAPPTLAISILLSASACTDDPDDAANDAGSETAGEEDLDDGSDSGAQDGSTGAESGESGGADTGESGGADTGEPGDPDGAALFATHCASCHGAEGEGTALAPTNRNPDTGYATWIVRNGRDDLPFDLAMPVFIDTALSDDEVAAIVEHLRSFDNPTTGEGLFVEACANCHGADARGGRVEKDITHEVADGGLSDVLEQVRQGEGGTNYAARTAFMRAWPDADLSDAEVQLVVDYILTLPPGPGD
jgi:ubiquinol-cytochrome c reductase cytochrome c subunit